MLLDQLAQGYEGSFVFRPIRQKSRFCKVNVIRRSFPLVSQTKREEGLGWRFDRKSRKFGMEGKS